MADKIHMDFNELEFHIDSMDQAEMLVNMLRRLNEVSIPYNLVQGDMSSGQIFLTIGRGF